MHKTCLNTMTIAIVISAIACSFEQTPISDHSTTVNNSAFQDTILKWTTYFESSSDGLWEDSMNYGFDIIKVHEFGGEYDTNPIFFNPQFVHVIGDTLLITDTATQSLVCMDTTGTLLWKFGESGEGPGYFAGIGQIDVIGDTIAVINNGLSAIELISRNGELIGRITLEWPPQDISFIDSKNLLIYSKAAPDGDLHMYDIQADSILFSFGDGEWEEWPNSGSLYEVWGVYMPPDSVIYISQFEKRMVFASIQNRTSHWTDIRELPLEITPTGYRFDEEMNMAFYTNYPVYRSVFIGPHGTVNLLFANLMYNGEMLRPGNYLHSAPVSIIDRFTVNGEYLDSYCLPDSSINIVSYNGNGYMAAVNANSGIIYGYRIVMNN
jgi:hypothetical protein